MKTKTKKKTKSKEKFRPISVVVCEGGTAKSMRVLGTRPKSLSKKTVEGPPKAVERVAERTKETKDRNKPIGNYEPILVGENGAVCGTQAKTDPVVIDVIPPKTRWQKFVRFLKNIFNKNDIPEAPQQESVIVLANGTKVKLTPTNTNK